MLTVRLMGALEVELDGAVVDSPASQRPWSLFAYLALSPRPVSRRELCASFWPDVLDSSARASLRSALWALRKALPDSIQVDGDGVALAHRNGVWVDAREFERLGGDEALALCRGELLEGFNDEWALLARERHRERVVQVLERLAVDAQTRGDEERALALTRRQIQTDPLDEAANRRLIERLDAAGDRAGAARAYQSLTNRLHRELGVAPSAATRALGEQLRPQPQAASNQVSAPGPLPLIGRQRELAALTGAWRQAAEFGASAVAVVRGEAGIGKTRLVSELRHAVGARAATCAALDLGGTAPLSLWAELLAELLPGMATPPPGARWPGDLTALLPTLPEHFPPAPAPEIVAPDLQRTRLFEAVVAAVQWAARSGPLLLILEDIHAADPASLELVAYASRRLAGRPVMMLLTRRDRPRRAEADALEQALRARSLLGCELELGPLAPTGVAMLARATARLTPEDVARVLDVAEGNALLAVESARALHAGRAGVAPSLRGSVAGALGRLTAEGRTVIDLLAVAARPVTTPELRALHLAEPERTTAEAFDTGLLHGGEHRLGFRHALLRDAAYEEIDAPRRAVLHHRWAMALASRHHEAAPAGAAEIARHLRMGGADMRAVPYLAQAAQGARAMGELSPAIAYLSEALAIDARRADLWLALGTAEAWRHRRDDAERAFQRAIDLAGTDQPLHAARAWLERARAFHGPLCVPRAVIDSATRALALLTDCPEAVDERLDALGDKAWSEAVAGDMAEADRLIAELEAAATPGDDMSAYHLGNARALALMRRGDFVESYAASIAGGEAIERVGRPDLAYGCWANAAGAANAAGDPDQALQFLDRGLTAVTGHGLAGLELQLHGFRAFVLSRAGRVEEARAASETQHRVADTLGDPDLSSVAAHDRGLVALERGDHAAAVTALSAALAVPSRISRPRTRLALAEALARAGQPERAAEQVRETALESVVPSDFPAALVAQMAGVQGVIATAQGDHERAEQCWREAVAAWSRLSTPALASSTLISVLADLGRPVVGLIEPERELARARANLESARAVAQGDEHAVV